MAAKQQAEAETALKAEEDAKRAEIEARQKAEDEARLQAELEAKREATAEAARKAEEDAKRRAAEAKRRAEAKRKAEEKKMAALEAKREAEAEARKLAEQESKRQAEAAARKRAEEDKLHQQQAKEGLKQQLEDEQKAEKSKSDAASTINEARAWILSRIKPKVERFSANSSGRSCSVRVTVRSGGYVESVSITQSSGDESFDRSVESAVLKASPLPWPDDEKVAHELRSFTLNVRSR